MSVASGGIVPKAALGYGPHGSGSASFDEGGGGGGAVWGRDRLVVDDPLTGRDVSAGTFRVGDLRLAFTRAARRLEALARGPRRGGGGSGNGAPVNYLSGLFDVESALRRGPRDLHGQRFPGVDSGAGVRGARRGGGGGGMNGGGVSGGRRLPPQVERVWADGDDGGYGDDELDLDLLAGDELLLPPTAAAGGLDGGLDDGGGGGGSRGGGSRRRRRQG